MSPLDDLSRTAGVERTTSREDRLPPVQGPPDDSPVDSTDPQHELGSGPSPKGSLLLEVLQTVILTLVIFFGVRTVGQNFVVDGASMDPTLQSGEYLLINKLVYWRLDQGPLSPLIPRRLRDHGYLFGGPRRGDVIVFLAPTAEQKDFIKRVVGLPGEEIRIVRGKVYVNGQLLDEPYLSHLATYDYPLNGQPMRVPPDHYFVLGDNRPNSSDSHYGWTVPAKDIIGKAWVSYWPPSEWRVLEDRAYANVGR